MKHNINKQNSIMNILAKLTVAFAISLFLSSLVPVAAFDGELDGVYRIWQKSTGRYLDAYDGTYGAGGTIPWSVTTRISENNPDNYMSHHVATNGGKHR